MKKHLFLVPALDAQCDTYVVVGDSVQEDKIMQAQCQGIAGHVDTHHTYIDNLLISWTNDRE